jgi:hypothetical protein
MAWQTPIFDRSSADVTYALANSGSSQELKGAFNFSDLNRIESNTKYLQALLLSNGISVSITTKENWNVSDFPQMVAIDRIRQNIKNIIGGFREMAGSPSITLGKDYLDIIDINLLEENINNVNLLLERMIAYFRVSGTFVSGEEVLLP